MKPETFGELFGEIDEAYVLEAREPAQRPVRRLRRWAALAACVCLVAAGILALWQSGWLTRGENADAVETAPGPAVETTQAGEDTVGVDYDTEESIAYLLHLEGREDLLYGPISFDERQQYGLVPEDAVGLTPENTYEITEADLGGPMGTTVCPQNPDLDGLPVYHFAQYPDYDAICIVETARGYEFYTCSWLQVTAAEGDAFSVIAEAYGLPESLERAEILAADFTYLRDLDRGAAAETLALLSETVNDGQEANERRFAQAWYNAYGNEDVYYSETKGYCVFRAQPQEETPVVTTDEAGNTTVSVNSADTSLYEQAQALWTKGERILRLTTDRGFQLDLDYFPSIATVATHNGYFHLSQEAAETLNGLLGIGAD